MIKMYIGIVKGVLSKCCGATIDLYAYHSECKKCGGSVSSDTGAVLGKPGGKLGD